MSEDFAERINSMNKGDFIKLLELIPQFQLNPDFGKIVVDEKTKEDVSVMPYYAPSELISEFIKIVYDMDIILPFDWIKWREGESLLSQNPQNFSNLDLLTLCKLITAIVRNDRFTEGYLLSKCNDGTVTNILLAIESKF
jgi:hypothetical protein